MWYNIWHQLLILYVIRIKRERYIAIYTTIIKTVYTISSMYNNKWQDINQIANYLLGVHISNEN